MKKQNKLNIRLVKKDEGIVVRAKINGKTVELRPFGNKNLGYCDDDSARRSWQKKSKQLNIKQGQYKYSLV